MAAYLQASDICVNCLKMRASQSIINKISDYFASGNPVINCGQSKEMKIIIDKYKVGINYEAQNIESCFQSIYRLISDKDMMNEMGTNARKLAEKDFDRKASYKKIISAVERVGESL